MTQPQFNNQETSSKSITDEQRTKKPQALRPSLSSATNGTSLRSSTTTFANEGPPNAPKGAKPTAQTIALDDILNGQREIVIAHDGEEYLLRLTSKNKLLLTK